MEISLPSTAMQSVPQIALVPSSVIFFPSTVTRPDLIHSSALRLEVTPAWDSIRLIRWGLSASGGGGCKGGLMRESV